MLLTYPFTDQVLKDVKGDYLNAYLSLAAAKGTSVIPPVVPSRPPRGRPGADADPATKAQARGVRRDRRACRSPITGIHYANLGRYLGLRGYYVVRLNLANGRRHLPGADVTYRGVSVGRVGTMRLTAAGVEADLNISNSAPPIPARLQATVADLSAVGEQYVDLRPATAHRART